MEVQKMTRRRYDTEALVGEIKRERRNAIVLGGAGAVLFACLVLFYLQLRDDKVPEVPPGPKPAVKTEAASKDAKPPADQAEAAKAPQAKAEAAAEPAEKKPEPKPDPTIAVSLPRALPVWIDGKLVGKLKSHKVTLAPGKHVVRTKVGRRSIEEKLDTEAGKHYQVSFDIRKRRASTVVSD